MRRICLVIPTLQPGGMERVISELAGYFAGNENTELHLVLYGKGREIFYSLPDKITIHRPEWPFNNNKRLWHTVKTLFFLRKKVKKIDPDTILSFGEYWNSFVLLALKGLGVPVYLSDRCQPDKYLGKLHERLRSLLYPGAAGIIAQTSVAKEIYLQRRLHTNIRVIGNPIRGIKTENAAASKENIVLTVGRLIDTKHHDRLIGIFHNLNAENWKLVIVGGNAIKQDGMGRLKKKIKELNLEGRVVLTGTVTNVEEYYLKSKIFAFTSSSEGFPNVIGEAMSAGLPVVTYNCVAGPSDMVKNGENGYLVDLFDDDTFEERLQFLINNPGKRKEMGAKSQEMIKRYSVENVGKDYFEFITANA